MRRAAGAAAGALALTLLLAASVAAEPGATPTAATTTTTAPPSADAPTPGLPPVGVPAATQPATMPTATTTTTTAPPGADGLPPIDVPDVRSEDGGGGGGGGIGDMIFGPVRRTIDGWFASLARAALTPLLDLLSTTLFATPDVTVPGTVRDYWAYSLLIGDAVLVLLVVIAGLVLMGHETVQTRTTVKEVAPRVLFAILAAHASLGFTGMLIRGANALSAGFLGDFDPKSGHAATEALIHVVLGVVAGGNVFLAILGIAVAALGIGVLCTYVARVANIVVLVGAAPLFLVAHAVPQLDGAARLWWRNLVGCLAVQVGQALVMSATLRVFFHDDGSSLSGMPGGGTMDLLLVGSLFWLMLRIPSYAGRMVFAPRSSNAITRQIGAGAVSQGAGAVTRAAA